MKTKIKILNIVLVVAFGFALALSRSSKTYAQGAIPAPTIGVEAIAVDSLGKILPGTNYELIFCTYYDNDPSWGCQSLSDPSNYPDYIAPLVNTGSVDVSLFAEVPPGNNCSDSATSAYLKFRQTAAPAGYTFNSGWNVICYTVNGWVADNGQIHSAPDGVVQPKASLAPGVTIQTTDNINLLFHGLMTKVNNGAASMPAPTQPQSTQPKPTLPETGSSQRVAITASLSFIFAGLLSVVWRRRKKNYCMR